MALFENQGKRAVSLTTAQADLAAEQNYLELTREILHYLEGQHLYYLAQFIRETHNDADALVTRLVLEAADMVAPVVGMLASAYNTAPGRTLAGSESRQAEFKKFLTATRWNQVWKHSNQIGTAARVCAILFGITEAAGWFLTSIPPDCFFGQRDALNPNKLARFAYHSLSLDDPLHQKTRTYGYTNEFIYWRDERTSSHWSTVFNDAYPVRDGVTADPVGRTPNPYGEIPVVLLYEQFVYGQVKPPADEALITAQRGINAKITMRNMNLKQLAFSIGVMFGNWEADQTPSPTTWVRAPFARGTDEKTGIEFVNPEPYIEDHHAAIEATWDQVARSKGLDPDSVRGRRTATSGYAQMLKDRRLHEHHDEQIDRRLADEQEAFELVRRMSKFAPAGLFRLEQAEDVSIEFSPMRVYLDPTQEYDQLMREKEDGLRPVDDLVRFIHNDLTTPALVDNYLAMVAERNAKHPTVGAGADLTAALAGLGG